MITRDETLKLMQALDEGGFSYSLNVDGPADHREYAVYVRLDRMDGRRLRELQDAIEQVPEAFVKVDQGVLRAS